MRPKGCWSLFALSGHIHTAGLRICITRRIKRTVKHGFFTGKFLKAKSPSRRCPPTLRGDIGVDGCPCVFCRIRTDSSMYLRTILGRTPKRQVNAVFNRYLDAYTRVYLCSRSWTCAVAGCRVPGAGFTAKMIKLHCNTQLLHGKLFAVGHTFVVCALHRWLRCIRPTRLHRCLRSRFHMGQSW